MSEIKQTRVQYPVGQGFFHSGCININNKEINYIYDCGSKKIGDLRREIKEYCNNLNTDQSVDALFISHFHNDHINGLEELFKRVSVDYVFIPYISPEEIILYVAEAINSGDLPSHEQLTLMTDPWKFFTDRDAREIIIIGPDYKEYGMEPTRLPLKGLDQDELRGSINIERRFGQISRENQMHVIMDHESKITLELKADKIWEFLTYVDPKPKYLEEFKNKQPVKDLMDDVGNLQQNLLSILRDKNKKKELANSYKMLFGDKRLNLTSLSLYSGPVENRADMWVRFILYSNHLNTDIPKFVFNDHIAWLGTGDSDLKSEERRNAFINHYQPFLKNVLTLALPHHGSKSNFDKSVLSEGTIMFCVASAGEENQYGHPHQEVVVDVNFQNCNFIWVSESRRTKFIEEFIQGKRVVNMADL